MSVNRSMYRKVENANSAKAAIFMCSSILLTSKLVEIALLTVN